MVTGQDLKTQELQVNVRAPSMKGSILSDLERLTNGKTKLTGIAAEVAPVVHGSVVPPHEIPTPPVENEEPEEPSGTAVQPDSREYSQDEPAHKVELPPKALDLDKQIVVEEKAVKGAEEKNTMQEHVVNMDTVKVAELKALDRLFKEEKTKMHAPDPELDQESLIADRALKAARNKLSHSLSVLKALEAQTSHLLLLVGVQGAVENQMADDKMQSDIVQQRKDALHEQLQENQKDIGLTQTQVNDIKIQEQVDATILSKLHNSGQNTQEVLDQIADVQGRLKHDKDTEHKLEASDLALEKKRLKLDGMIVEQDLLKRGLEAQAKREEEMVVRLQGANGGSIAGQLIADHGEAEANKPKPKPKHTSEAKTSAASSASSASSSASSSNNAMIMRG
jgi:hypothetical protein